MEARTTTATAGNVAAPHRTRGQRSGEHLTLSTSPVANSPAASSSIILRPATDAERRQHSLVSAPSWKGPLSTAEAFVRREELLHNTQLCRDGGITGWVLVDRANGGRVLMGGETIKKRGLVARAAETTTKEARDVLVEEVLVHSVGAVFCPEENRGRGYARRFMEELALRLAWWQAEDGEKVVSVLYSEIGGDFYARHGWNPHPSRHIRVDMAGGHILRHDDGISWPKGTYPVLPQDVAALAERDETLMRRRLTREVLAGDGNTDAFALVPDEKTFDWFRAREIFVSGELAAAHGKKVTAPGVTGAVVRDADGRPRAWCLWTCMWLEPGLTTRGRNTLYILRLVMDDGDDEENKDEGDRVDAVAALLEAAKTYAGRWGMGGVEFWNPDQTTTEAATRVSGDKVEVVERTVESIACLNMYDDGEMGTGVRWVANEKFGWC
jgi:predicted GNAT family N-acyltransferase